MTQRLATIAAALGFAVISLAAPGDCAAMWEVRYDGPDQITLVERPNSAGRNVTRSGAHEKDLAKGRLEAGDCFETAMRYAYRAALCAPEFLYHTEVPGDRKSTRLNSSHRP